MAKFNKTKATFKPRARMLVHLGEQLIRDSGIAVFELVKNSYDADATDVLVEMLDLKDSENGKIIISDNGSGMDWDIITKAWMEPGTDFRQLQKEKVREQPEKSLREFSKFGRLPMGEKGIGRFAVHKLGRNIEVITRAENKPEIVVEIDWEKFLGEKYLDDTPVEIIERKPVVFTGNKTGTKITVTSLTEKWNRGMARNVVRAINSICSPFHQPSDFQTKVKVEPDYEWLEGLLELDKVMEFAMHKAKVKVSKSGIKFDYEFDPLPGMDRVKPRKEKGQVWFGGSVNPEVDILYREKTRKAFEKVQRKIGDFEIELKIFDLDYHILEFANTEKSSLRKFLRNNGGVRVYRDEMRIFDYGEPGNDWLELGIWRVNIPTRRISNNLIIGAVHLNGKTSPGLVEKTNREGFVENQAFHLFKDMVFQALVQVVAERNKDKLRIRKAYSSKKFREPVMDELEVLRGELKKRKIEKELENNLVAIERAFIEVKDRLLTAAGPGLTMSVVIHEVEKGIGGIVKAVQRNAGIEELKILSTHLEELVEGLTYLTRRSGRKRELASNLIKQAIFNTNYRTKAHDIKIFNGTETGDKDFQAKCTRRLVIATLINLIDNSIYWLDNKGAKDKKIYLGTTFDLPGGPGLVIADNGPGFADAPEYMIEPFFTRKPDGMGLGLHIANEIMKVHEGKLVFPEKGDIELPKKYDGAVVVLRFKE